jgi:CheY-like chemotaxis protein
MIISSGEILDASILIVDDQQANVALLGQLLSDAGYTSRRVDDGILSEVCALHRKNGYDLILLDLQMPLMDGFQVMEGLKTNVTDAYLPVLVITAQPGHKLRALQAGARDFVSKPFDLVEVRTRIRNMLEVRLVYKQLEELQRGTGTDGAGAHRRTARKRSALSQPDRAGFGLVLGAGREDEFHEGFRSGPRDAWDPASGPSWRETSDVVLAGWNEAEREVLQATIAARQPFLDFLFHRVNADGSQQRFRVSGEPMFNRACRFIGYRGNRRRSHGLGTSIPRSPEASRCPTAPRSESKPSSRCPAHGRLRASGRRIWNW